MHATWRSFLAAVCYFHEVYVVAKNIFIQLRCLLEDIGHSYLDLTVYDMPNSLFSSHTHFYGITELCRRPRTIIH